MKNGDIVEYDDKDERNKPAVFVRKVSRGKHKGKCVIRINLGGKEKLRKIDCKKLRQK